MKTYIIILFFIIILNLKIKFLVIFLIILLLFLLFYNNYKTNIISCRNSTINNPLGNILLYSQLHKYDLDLCNNQDNNIENNLRYNIYNDANDIYLKNNNIRQFIHMPSQQHPNNINKFKNYLFNVDNKTCKLDNKNCVINDDIRYYK